MSKLCPHCHAELTPSKPRKAKVRAIDHADATSENDTIRRAYYTATEPETTAMFYARHAVHPNPADRDAWRLRFMVLAGQLESSTAAASSRKRETFALIDEFRASAQRFELPTMTEDQFWADVARQSDAWRAGVEGAPYVPETMPADVAIELADEQAPEQAPLMLEREIDRPAAAA